MKKGFAIILVGIMLMVAVVPAFAGNHGTPAAQLCNDYDDLGYESFSACVSEMNMEGHSLDALIEHCKETDNYGRDNLGECVKLLRVIF